jgi:glycerate kinase
MRLRVLIVPDKFKGTLTAMDAAEAIARGWCRARPDDELELLPMSDGGDGFGGVMSALLGAVPQSIDTCDAAHRACRSQWWWEPRTKTVVIESAAVVGLAMLPPKRYHPFELDTYGLGTIVRAAADRGARRCLVGLGGSATNDGGFGLAHALGWRFLNQRRKAIERWTELPTVVELRPPRRIRWFEHLQIAVDVQNPLLGPRGATRVYGPQKGFKPAEFPAAENCLRRLVALVRAPRGCVLASGPGAGAAGGLGFGFAAFLGGGLEPGFELFAREVKLERHLGRADLVITGEGEMDRSTFMGKGAGQIARHCQRFGVPCIGLAGIISPDLPTKAYFAEARALADLTTLRKAKSQPAAWLERLAKQVADESTADEQQTVINTRKGKKASPGPKPNG